MLADQGFSVDGRGISYPRRNDVSAVDIRKEVQGIYVELGGVLSEFPLRLRRWDLQIGNVAVELDEERHFNRYRRRTLDSRLYSQLPLFPLAVYREYCDKREAECLSSARYGGYWSNRSCVSQFGLAAPEGDLEGHGSPRWKQRAFYDFVKDLSPLVLGIPLARVSIWDLVQANGTDVLVAQALATRSEAAIQGIVQLIEARAGSSLGA